MVDPAIYCQVPAETLPLFLMFDQFPNLFAGFLR